MKSHALTKVVALATAVITIGAGGFVLMKGLPGTIRQSGPSSYTQLITLPETDLAGWDIALMNLLCAEGLPGAGSLDVKKCLAVLAQWADVVRQAESK